MSCFTPIDVNSHIILTSISTNAPSPQPELGHGDTFEYKASQAIPSQSSHLLPAVSQQPLGFYREAPEERVRLLRDRLARCPDVLNERSRLCLAVIEAHASRVTASLSKTLGIDKEFVARSEDEFVQIAITQSTNVALLTRLRRELPTQFAETLGNTERFTREFEEALRKMWWTFCGIEHQRL